MINITWWHTSKLWNFNIVKGPGIRQFGGYGYEFDYSKPWGLLEGAGHVFKIFKLFGSRVIRSKPALLTGLTVGRVGVDKGDDKNDNGQWKRFSHVKCKWGSNTEFGGLVVYFVMFNVFWTL